ncbi:MAG: ribosome maturation factor RimM [Cocleimonas sp.]
MSQSDDYILLGKISGVHGIKGWVKVFSYTSPRVKITEYSQWYVKSSKGQSWVSQKLTEGKVQGKNIIARLDGINYRDEAEALVGTEIAIHKDQLEVLAENEYFWRDLIGLSVETISGEKLGKIDWLFDTGSNDVIIVKDTESAEEKEHLLPYLFDDVIKSIDLEKSLMVVDWDPEF